MWVYAAHIIPSFTSLTLLNVRFFSLHELLEGLLTIVKSETSMSQACTFREYTHSHKGYSELSVDISEAENEISGVILGSIVSFKSAKLLEVWFSVSQSIYSSVYSGCCTGEATTL
jgi:hypothetical protein